MEHLIPRKGQDCQNCKFRIPDEYPHPTYPCKEVIIEEGIMTSPRIKSGTCESYQPNLAISFRELITDPLLFQRILLSLHPF